MSEQIIRTRTQKRKLPPYLSAIRISPILHSLISTLVPFNEWTSFHLERAPREPLLLGRLHCLKLISTIRIN